VFLDIKLSPKDIVYSENDDSTSLYFIKYGSIEVIIVKNYNNTQISALLPIPVKNSYSRAVKWERKEVSFLSV